MAECFAGGHMRFMGGEWRDDNGDVVEIERVVHAYWQLYKERSFDNSTLDFRCSHCKGFHFHNGAMRKKYKRCPNCGAKMDISQEVANGATRQT